jgi:hypothetical protein
VTTDSRRSGGGSRHALKSSALRERDGKHGPGRSHPDNHFREPHATSIFRDLVSLRIGEDEADTVRCLAVDD